MVNLFIFLSLYFLLIFSSFLVVEQPFILFFFHAPPGSMEIYSNNFISIGVYNANFQLAVVFLAALLLNPKLIILFMSIYMFIGFYYFPVFYSGFGPELLKHPSLGYILSLYPVSIILSLLSWRKKEYEKYLLNPRFTFSVSVIGLLFIHLTGTISAYYILRDTDYLEIIRSYFLVPFFSQIILIAIVCVFASYFNRFKFYLIIRIRRFIDSVLNRSLKRKKIIKKQAVNK